MKAERTRCRHNGGPLFAHGSAGSVSRHRRAAAAATGCRGYGEVPCPRAEPEDVSRRSRLGGRGITDGTAAAGEVIRPRASVARGSGPR